MKSIYIVIPLLFSSILSFAQINPLTVSGKVYEDDNIPIAYANVMLKSINDNSIIYGDLSDEQGNFNVQNLPKGVYLLTASFIGYQPYQQEIDLTENISLPIRLEEGLELNEVVITAQKKNVTYEKGRINLTVENSKLSNLPTVTDILSFVPGIIVEQENISVIGKGKPLIFIDGKEIKSMIQIESLQPEMIKNITLDRNPSAKYDASYNSIIYITTKRNLGKDFSVQYIEGAGMNHHFTHSETSNLNHTSGKFTNFLSSKFKNSKNTESANTYQNILINDSIQSNSYDAEMQDNNDIYSLTLGSNVKLNDNNRIDVQYFFNETNQGADITGWESMEGTTNKRLNVNRNGNTNEQDHTVNLSYQLTIDSVRFLQFFGDYTHLKNASIERIVSEEQANHSISKDTLNNHSTFDTYSLRTEYNTKLFSDYDWTFGARYSGIKSNARSKMNGNNTESFFNNQSALTETNTAVYTTLARQFNSFYIELGLRAEFTHDQYDKNGVSIFDKPRNSAHLFPSFLINYDISKNLQLNLNYTSKIQRPSFYDLDPTLSYLSSVLYLQGNPGLNPMIEHNIELSGIIKRKFNVSIAYKIQENLPVYMIEPSADNANILINKPVNIPRPSLLDFTATYTLQAGSLTSNLIGNFAIPFVEYPYNGKMIKNNIPLYQIVAGNQYAISPTLFLFCNFNFKSEHSSINTVISPTYQLTAGVNWVLMRGKMILTLFGNDLLHKSAPTVTSKYSMVDFGQSSNPDTRMVGITLKYNFNGFRNIFKKSDSNQSDLNRITK